MNFCCKDFEEHYLLSNNWAFNIRIVKIYNPKLYALLSLDREINVTCKKEKMFRYVYTEGYETFDPNYSIPIDFCPFCGTHLAEYYKNDKYANEIEGDTFVCDFEELRKDNVDNDDENGFVEYSKDDISESQSYYNCVIKPFFCSIKEMFSARKNRAQFDFCCDNLQMFNNQTETASFKIVKYVSSDLVDKYYTINKNGRIKKKEKRNPNLYFLFCQGYDNFEEEKVQDMWNFCPWCGTCLHEYYTSDKYANEIEQKTFPKNREKEAKIIFIIMFIFLLIGLLRLPVELEINMSAIFKIAIIPSVALFFVFCIKAILSFRKEIKKKLSDLLFPVLALLPIWIACVFVIGFITCFLDVINYYIPTNNENYVKKVIVNDLVYSKQNSVYFIPEDSSENDVYIIGMNNEEFKNYEIGEKYNMILKDGALGFPIYKGIEKIE